MHSQLQGVPEAFVQKGALHNADVRHEPKEQYAVHTRRSYYVNSMQ